MQAAQEAEASDRAARQGEGAGAAEAARAEFRGMFVSLVDPAGLLYMDRCAEIAGRMGDAASRAGYGAGARMAASLAEIFADTDSIVGRQVDDTALDCTYVTVHGLEPAQRPDPSWIRAGGARGATMWSAWLAGGARPEAGLQGEGSTTTAI